MRVVNNSNFSFIDLNECDMFSSFDKLDLKQLFLELENFSLLLRPTIHIKKHITFGVEIEFEEADYKTVEQQLKENFEHSWELKEDKTTMRFFNNHECGGEIVTPILTDTKETWQEIRKVCMMLKSLNAQMNNQAGLHIHFGSNIFENNKDYLLNLLKMWAIYEKIAYRFGYGDKLGDRVNIVFAKPISYYIIERLFEFYQADDLKNLLKMLPLEKNQAINFKNIRCDETTDKNTIEFRCPNGTLNAAVLQNDVNFFAKLMIYCKSPNFDNDLILKLLKKEDKNPTSFYRYNNIYQFSALKLFDLIFDNNLDKICALKQYLKSFQKELSVKDKLKQIKL